MSKRKRSSKQLWSSLAVLLMVALVDYFNALQAPAGRVTATLPPPVTLPAGPPVSSASPDFPVSLAPEFDYYVLSLSWSPEYCATDGSNDTQQCSLGRKLGFVLHGLWPQYERGYPSNCADTPFPASLQQDFAGLYPSDALFRHEWEKHGTCSGLQPADYLVASRALRDAVTIPDAYRSPPEPFRTTAAQLVEDFLAANPALQGDGLAVWCSDSGRFLRELRVCFTPAGEARPCSAEILRGAAKSCGQANFLVRNVK